ncbi:MAG: type III-A CRISPR-associated RAMP protein Csm5 [Lachnospiraceae bacterium]|nr:type III-A CRISPR-associated RAMP protein Csm5 [Lachnospiraceae bacterium]
MKVYKLDLLVKGPLFVGSGMELLKKEYYYDRVNKKIIIPDIMKMYSDLEKLKLQQEYESYLLNENRKSLGEWFLDKRIKEEQIESWTKYKLDCADAIFEKGKTMQIMQCVKDAYGLPYIPGSSLKGMLRTILLAYNIHNNKADYSRAKREIYSALEEREKRKKVMRSLLQKETKSLEQQCFNKLTRTRKKYESQNDIMSGIIVSDSIPVALEDLTLCQKLECNTEGNVKRLNLLRECIKPETKLEFMLTIDESICKYTIEYIMDAIKYFSENVYNCFIKKYPNTDLPTKNTVWLGGGAGYVSKTVVYNLFDRDAVDVVSEIFKGIGVNNNHKHFKDVRLGVSPHILKLTQYKGKRYQFGMCQISISAI